MNKSYWLICTLLLLMCSCKSVTDNEILKNEVPKNDSAVFDLVKKNQILLTNDADFKDHSSLYGASAFLVKFSSKTYAITAKHLIGEAGGVEPEINITELKKYFLSWRMYPRVAVDAAFDTVIIAKPTLTYDSVGKDILMLEVENGGYHILPLDVNLSLPAEGDTLFIVGCPYSEENCRQNIYKVVFNSFDPDLGMLISIAQQKLELAGFSGAPLLNRKGEVVAVVTSGWEENNNFYVSATSIREIEKIK